MNKHTQGSYFESPIQMRSVAESPLEEEDHADHYFKSPSGVNIPYPPTQ